MGSASTKVSLLNAEMKKKHKIKKKNCSVDPRPPRPGALSMAARIKPPNRNNRQPVDLSNEDAAREFFRKQWHRPKRKAKKKVSFKETSTIVKTIKINGKLVQVKTKARLSDDENSKKLCRKGFLDD